MPYKEAEFQESWQETAFVDEEARSDFKCQPRAWIIH